MARQDTNIIPIDFEHYVDSLIRYMRVNLPNDYQDFLESNAARVLVDAISFEMSLLAYMVNANLKQMFIPTSTTRRAMFLLGKLVDYDLKGPIPSTAAIKFYLDEVHAVDININKGTQITAPGVNPITFETTADAVLTAGTLEVVVAAQQGITVNEIIGTTSSTQTLNQQYKSTRPPLIDTISLSIENIPWVRVDNIFDLDENERGYTAKPDEDGFALITFGNGTFGLIPPPGEDISVTYKVGGGVSTNVGSNSIIQANTTFQDVLGSNVTVNVTNEEPAFGGLNEETIEEARVNIPRAVRSMDRFVSREDFQSVPETFTDPSVGTVFKSTATVKYIWAEHIITVFILGEPESGRLQPPTIPGQALLDAVREFIEERTLPTIAISVEAARFLELDIFGTVYYQPNFREDTIKTNIDAALELIFDNSIREIGDGMRLSDIYAALDNAIGVDYVDLTLPMANKSVLDDQYIVPGTITLSFVRMPKSQTG
jgi:hypothetical protein